MENKPEHLPVKPCPQKFRKGGLVPILEPPAVRKLTIQPLKWSTQKYAMDREAHCDNHYCHNGAGSDIFQTMVIVR
jgi:hypothetical protein